MYITGGVGTAQYHDEGFGDPFRLPNRTYCESCANIAQVLWQHRMNLLTGRALTDRQQQVALTAVPYYAWCNREKGPMTVWIDEASAMGM